MAKTISKISFVQYMDKYDLYREGAWAIVAKLATRMGFNVDIAELRKKYAETKRILVTKN